MNEPLTASILVGPVLLKGHTCDAIVSALEQQHGQVRVVDRGSYLRVLVEREARLSRASVEELLGRPFRIPSDLEPIMPSFVGVVRFTNDAAVWSLVQGGST